MERSVKVSKIYFHSSNKTAAVHGSERYLFSSLCSGITWSVLDNVAKEYGDQKSILRKARPQDHYALQSRDFAEDLAMSMRVGQTDFLVGDKRVSGFSLSLNTAYFMGSDPVKLAARLHGQCEIHAYVEGANRRWLSEIIKHGRDIELYRSGMGWESVIDLLLIDDNSPVVTSYSVCDTFPNSSVANYTPPTVDGELDYDAWYDLPLDKQWAMAIDGLKKSGRGLELRPDNWNKFYFDDGIDANKLVSMLRSL